MRNKLTSGKLFYLRNTELYRDVVFVIFIITCLFKMSSERDEVLSLNDSEEGSFSGFSPLRHEDSDMEPSTSANKKKPKSVVKKVTDKTKGAKALGTKSARGQSKQRTQTKGVTPVNKENETGSQTSCLNNFDITKLSENDILKLREVLGINTNNNLQQYADDNDIQSVFGQPLDSLPSIHVEVDSCDISDNDMPQPSTRTNMAKNLSQALFEPEEGEIVDWDLPRLKVPEKGKAISNSLAKMINVACTSQCQTDTLVNKYKVPENCDFICPPTVNGEIWKVLDKRAQSQDRGMVDIQNLLATAMTPIMQLADVLKPHIMANNEAKSLLADTLTLMGQAQYNLSVRRRYFIRPNLKKKYSGLCNISTPITTNLFGDDMARDIKNCDSVNFLGKDQGYYYKTGHRGRAGRYSNIPRKSYFSSQNSGYGNYGATARFQPYPQRGQFRQNSTRTRGVRRAATATAPNDQV